MGRSCTCYEKQKKVSFITFVHVMLHFASVVLRGNLHQTRTTNAPDPSHEHLFSVLCVFFSSSLRLRSFFVQSSLQLRWERKRSLPHRNIHRYHTTRARTCSRIHLRWTFSHNHCAHTPSVFHFRWGLREQSKSSAQPDKQLLFIFGLYCFYKENYGRDEDSFCAPQ